MFTPGREEMNDAPAPHLHRAANRPVAASIYVHRRGGGEGWWGNQITYRVLHTAHTVLPRATSWWDCSAASITSSSSIAANTRAVYSGSSRFMAHAQSEKVRKQTRQLAVVLSSYKENRKARTEKERRYTPGRLGFPLFPIWA
jgi:hypothetical protein